MDIGTRENMPNLAFLLLLIKENLRKSGLLDTMA